MKFSTTTRYGLRAMTYIAHKNRICSTHEISQAEEIPFAYLEKIILKLSKNKLIKVKRGASGGYFLARKPEDINVDEIVTVLENTSPIVPCIDPKYKCSRRKICPTKNIWDKIDKNIHKTLKNITLKELISS